jgi:hypothetical protein
MNHQSTAKPRSLIIAFIVLCGMLLACEGLIDTGGVPPTLSPSEITAQANLRQSRIATAEAAVASGLVRETKIITSVASVFEDPDYDYGLHFDGKRLWVSHRKEVLAIDPESGEIITDPLTLDGHFSEAVVSDGQQVWWQTDSGLQAVDVSTGKPGAFIPVKTGAPFLAYDSQRLWFFGHEGLLSADPVSRQIMPPIAPDRHFNDGVIDDTHTFLWLANTTDDIVQKYDLKQNQLLDTPLRFYGPDSLRVDDGRLWVQNDTYDWASYDTLTGEKVASLHEPGVSADSALGGGRFWSSDPDAWTIRSYDTATGKPYPPIPVAGIPTRLAFDGKRLWFMLFDPETQKLKGLQYIIPK